MALSAPRDTRMRGEEIVNGGVAASQTIHQGALVMRNASGYLVKGATAIGLVGVGRAEKSVTNSGSAGDEKLNVRTGCFHFKNSSAGDAITIAEIGDVCFAVDDEQVAKTDNSAARSPAGFVQDVDAQGVWVRFDEIALTAYLAGITLPA